MQLSKNKILETSLVLTTAFIVVYILSDKIVFVYIALGLGLTGIFIKPMAKLIAVAWFKLAEMLNFVFSKIILGALFFLFLFPIAVFYRMAGKDKMKLKKSLQSNWSKREHNYSSNDLKNIW